MEKIVRDAKQRFRDTLPTGYLNDEEYALYVRLYGPPLRETAPEDVGIDTHADMADPPPRQPNEGTALKELEGGEFEEIAYEIPPKEEALLEDEVTDTIRGERDETDAPAVEMNEGEELDEDLVASLEQALAGIEGQHLVEQRPNYVQSVARSQREADALQRLTDDFARSQNAQREADHQAAAEEEEARADEVLESAEAISWPAEFGGEHGPPSDEAGAADAADGADADESFQRFHPYTVEGSFHGNSMEMMLPREELVGPISELLRRTHIDHVRGAAERRFGGAGLPLSSETLVSMRNGHMGGVGLLANQRHMTEIEADAFMAGFMPGAYASISCILREVRKRMGGEWLKSKLREGGEGLSVLDAGSGGAGLIAWDKVLQAEWELLKEDGEVTGAAPQGRKTVIVGSDRLRNRLKTFLQDTTFLPRMPDYEHSGEMRGPRLDGGGQEQPRKSFDVIIASHLLLKEKESHRRQAILNNLWHLLKKDGGVLLLLEKGHPRGFEAMAHARHTIVHSFLLPQSGEPRVAPEDFNIAFHREPEPGHIIAPCTNQGACPMYAEPGKGSGRKDFCRFSQRFVRPNFYTRMLRKQADNHGDVEFSYVAVQRGVARPARPTGREATEMAHRGYEGAEEQPDMQTLPRMVQPTLKRKGHVTMDMCTPEGKIERWTVPKSFSRLAYHDARKSRWGDLWALGAKTRVERTVRSGQTAEMGKRADGSRMKRSGRKMMADLEDGGDDDGDGDGGVRRRRGPPPSRKQREADALRALREAEEEEVDEIEDELVEEVEGRSARG